jgi:hypothetical protein
MFSPPEKGISAWCSWLKPVGIEKRQGAAAPCCPAAWEAAPEGCPSTEGVPPACSEVGLTEDPAFWLARFVPHKTGRRRSNRTNGWNYRFTRPVPRERQSARRFVIRQTTRL